MIEVRPATLEDIPRCVEAGKRFHQFSPYRDIPYCEETMREGMEAMIDQEMLIVAFNDGEVCGGIGGNIGSCFINKNCKMAYELYWWVDPEQRGRLGLRLLNAFEAQAKELGCYLLMMMTLDINDIGPLFIKLGYEKAETGFIKRLERWAS